MPLLAETAADAGRRADPAGTVVVGELVGRLWTLRQLSTAAALSVAAAATHAAPIPLAENELPAAWLLAREGLPDRPEPACGGS